MKILVVSHLFPTEDNPVLGRFVLDQVRSLQALGLSVVVVSGRPLWISPRSPRQALQHIAETIARPARRETYQGVELFRFAWPTSPFIPVSAASFVYTAAMLRLGSRLKAQKFDLVHAHTALLDGSAGTAMAARLGVPLILTEHTGPFSTLLRTPIMARRTRRAMDAAWKVLAVSSALAEAIAQSGSIGRPEKIGVLPNGVDTDFLDPALNPAPLTNTTPKTLLWVGHFEPVKRLDRLLQAFSSLAKQRQDVRLRLVGPLSGSDPYRQQAMELGIADLVDFAGRADRPTLRRHLAEASALVVSSEVETFGVAAVEAMSMGVPVVATNCGGPADIVTQNTGLIVENSTEGLARGLATVLDGLGSFDRQVIREDCVTRFSNISVARRLTAVYREALSHAHGDRA